MKGAIQAKSGPRTVPPIALEVVHTKRNQRRPDVLAHMNGKLRQSLVPDLDPAPVRSLNLLNNLLALLVRHRRLSVPPRRVFQHARSDRRELRIECRGICREEGRDGRVAVDEARAVDRFKVFGWDHLCPVRRGGDDGDDCWRSCAGVRAVRSEERRIVERLEGVEDVWKSEGCGSVKAQDELERRVRLDLGEDRGAAAVMCVADWGVRGGEDAEEGFCGR